MMMLFANQYKVRPAGTLREKKPIMSGRNFKMAWLCCCAGSSVFGWGLMICWDTYCDATSKTGSTR